MRCRSPKEPAGNMAEFVPTTGVRGMLKAICPTCHTMMNRCVNGTVMQEITRRIEVTFPLGGDQVRTTCFRLLAPIAVGFLQIVTFRRKLLSTLRRPWQTSCGRLDSSRPAPRALTCSWSTAVSAWMTTAFILHLQSLPDTVAKLRRALSCLGRAETHTATPAAPASRSPA